MTEFADVRLKDPWRSIGSYGESDLTEMLRTGLQGKRLGSLSKIKIAVDDRLYLARLKRASHVILHCSIAHSDAVDFKLFGDCLLYTSPSPRDH